MPLPGNIVSRGQRGAGPVERRTTRQVESASRGIMVLPSEEMQSVTAGEAMRQSEHKEYALRYPKDGRKIMLLGVKFNFSSGNITDRLKKELR